MKAISIFVLFSASLVWAQTDTRTAQQILPKLADGDTAAILDDGTVLTAGQLRGFAAALDPQNQMSVVQSPESLISEINMMHKLSKMAEQRKLDQRSPTREQLEYNRMLFLSQVLGSDLMQEIQVEPKDLLNYYNTNKNKYKQVKVDAIYIAFGEANKSSGTKKILSEAEAKAKGTKLLGQLRGGADFAKMAKENSDDETSRDKGGFLTTLNPADNVPDAFKVVFQMKEGEISEPVRQENGYYLLKADTVTVHAFSEVRDQIFGELKTLRFKDAMDKIHNDLKLTYPNPAFQPKAPAANSGSGK